MSKLSHTYNGRKAANQNHSPQPEYKVAVFGASSMMNDPGYKQDAEDLGRTLAKKKYHLIYGGGSRGLMGIVSKTALDNGGKITGYMMSCFNEGEHYPQRDYEKLCETIAERKQKMLLEADAYIALGGGFGTLDEILEAGVEQYLGGYVEPPVKMKPIILVNRNGLYDPFLAQLEKFIEEGSARPEVRDFFTVVESGREAVSMLEKMRKAPAKMAIAIGNVGQGEVIRTPKAKP